MKRHSFNQSQVLILGLSKREKDAKWAKFKAISEEFGYEVRVTGGNFLTHEITCTEEEFETILELVAEPTYKRGMYYAD